MKKELNGIVARMERPPSLVRGYGFRNRAINSGVG